MIHPEERQAWLEAREQHEAAEAAIGKGPELPEEFKQRHRALVSQAKRMADTCPDLWEELQKLRSPGMNDVPLGWGSDGTFDRRICALMAQGGVAMWLEELRTWKYDEEEANDG